MVALLAPVGIVMIQRSPSAAQIDELSVTSSGGRIFYAGGYSTSMDGFTATTELYDPASATFAPANQTVPMNSQRDGATANLLASGPNTGKVLIAGGVGGEVLRSSQLPIPHENRIPARNKFCARQPTATMNNGREAATSSVLTTGPNAGKILLAGGTDAVGPLASTELYNPATNTFAPANQTASMNSSRYGATATVLTIGADAGKILIAGGADLIDSLASTELYDPASNTFAPANQTATMNSARYGATATVIVTGPNAGKILIAGGFGASPTSVPLASTELYDPVTNTFAASNLTATMNTPRYLQTATVIATGLNAGGILFTGGFSSSGPIASTIYGPLSNSFAPANQHPTMAMGRALATASTIMTGANAGKILSPAASPVVSVPGVDGTLQSRRQHLCSRHAARHECRSRREAVQLPDNGPSPITFVGAGLLSDNSSPVAILTVNVPAGVQAGDIMLAQLLIYDGTGYQYSFGAGGLVGRPSLTVGYKERPAIR